MTTPGETVIHVWGFVDPDGPSEVGVALYEGPVHEIANRVLDAVRSHGHEVKMGALRTLDGDLIEAHASVTVAGGKPMWHRFLTAGEQWSMAEVRS